MEILYTHNIYNIYYARREAVKGREIYGDKQVHITALNTNKLPIKVSKNAKPFKKEKDSATWYYLPNLSIEMILIVFKQTGYDVVGTREARDRLGKKSLFIM